MYLNIAIMPVPLCSYPILPLLFVHDPLLAVLLQILSDQ